MATNTKHLPAGLKLLKRLRGGKDLNANSYRTSVLIITFISYAFYHMSRKPPSIVKTVLDPEDNIHSSPHYSLPPLHTWPANYLLAAANSNAKGDAGSNVLATQESTRRNARAAAQTNGTGLISSISSIEYDEGWSKSSRDDGELTTLQQGRGWPPFDGKTGKARLGEVDLAFLASYAIGMYFAGHLGDRLHLRLFLTAGMAISGFFVCLFGLGYWLDIHSFSYFIGVQMFAGLFQATGWPSVVTVVGNWHGMSRRGLIMGIWNAHTSAGNILGSLIAAAVLKYGWGWSFLLPGLLLASGGLVIFLFLVVEPADVGLPSPHKEDAAQGRLAVNYGGRDAEDVGQAQDENVKLKEVASDGEEKDLEEGCHDSQTEIQQLLDLKDNEKKQAMPFFYKTDPDAIGFLEGWRIPGVATFALCLFFAKLVAYTFLYWLPFYIRHTQIAGEFLDDKMAGNLSTLFDVGGVVGGILAGYLSDHLKARAITAASFMFAAIPALYCYRLYGSISLPVNIGLMMVTGMLINGPYALITTAVSADLGTHRSIRENGRALATVTAIIDGTGSVGAAIGPLLTGYISSQGWGAVFIMLMVAAFFSGILLTRLIIAELVEIFGKKPTVPSFDGEIGGDPNGLIQPLLDDKH